MAISTPWANRTDAAFPVFAVLPVVLPENMSGDRGKNLLEHLQQITEMMAAQLGEEEA